MLTPALVPLSLRHSGQLKSWGSQVELAEEFERGIDLSHASFTGLSDLFDQDALSLVSSDSVESMLLAPSSHAEVDEDSVCTEPSSASSAYGEFLDVMARRHEKQEVTQGRLSRLFLSGHNCPSLMSLPFLPELHMEVNKSWKKSYSACVFSFQHSNCANVEGLPKRG